jgi:nitric oxide reductase NorQ protein
MLVISYNPGYQSVLKTLKPSTRQRFVALSFDYPKPEAEAGIVARETGVDLETARMLVRLAGRLRELKGQDLEEGASTRLLVACANLLAAGMKRDEAIAAALIEPLTDDPDVKAGLFDLVQVTLG